MNNWEELEVDKPGKELTQELKKELTKEERLKELIYKRNAVERFTTETLLAEIERLQYATTPEDVERRDYLQRVYNFEHGIETNERLPKKEENKLDEQERLILERAFEQLGKFSENYSDFDMYQGTKKSVEDVLERDLKENLKPIGKIIDSSVRLEHAEEPDVDVEKEKADLEIEEFAKNPTFTVKEMKAKIRAMDDKSLSAEGRDLKYLILINLEKLNKTRILEPHFLAKVYKHHRYDPPKFN